MATDRPLDPGAYRWTTYAERLQAAGVDWKVYQEYDNFGDNLLSLFPPFRPCARDSALYRRGRSWVSEHRAGADRIRSDGTQLVAAFRDDIAGGRLPQVSWIVPAAELSEHPTHAPAKGEHLVAQLIAALVDHPAVFARTVLILNYDEPGGFFDHMPPPIPPVGGYRGRSTVPLDGEAKAYRGTGLADDAVHPLGLGYRTPTVIVSPWTRGGHVCSQLFDHTSVLRFLEARFGVVEPNISAWRRAVCGDLTACFDFTGAAAAPLRPLPDTADVRARVARSAAGSGFAIPAVQAPTAQMPGQRGHRPLPYRFAVDCRPDAAGRPVLAMVNTGPVGIVLAVHDQYHREAPHHFTIGAGDRIDADWPVGEAGFDCIVHGPNGCWRRFAGRAGAAATVVRLVDHPAIEAVAVHIDHAGPHPADVTVTFGDDYPAAGDRVRRLTVAPGRPVRDLWRLAASDGWYDLTVTCTADAQALWRYAGKVETGRQGHTDPAIGTMRL